VKLLGTLATTLRERPKDILPLADHFLEAYTIRSGRSFNSFSEGAKSTLLDYQYPGNVRELRNIVNRTAILCPSEVSLIGTEHLDIHGEALEEMPSQSDQSSDETEHDRILRTLQENQWNRSRVAKTLGMPYSTLRYKIERLRISQRRD